MVLTVGEAASALARMQANTACRRGMPYGAGMRINEALRLRVTDVDFKIVSPSWFAKAKAAGIAR